MKRKPDIQLSLIVPVGLRYSNVNNLHAEYRQGLAACGLSHEFVYVLDGPNPDVEAGLETLQRAREPITVVALTRTFGESTALMAGFDQTSGDVIMTLPAYHQIDAGDIPKLLAGLDTADIVISRRWPRAGGVFEKARRGLFHRLVSWTTGLQLHDLGCGARAMKRRVLEEVSLYGDQHRLLPVLADRQGFHVREVDMRQSGSDRFEGAYRTREYAHRLLDMFAVFFLVRFTKKPLRFFGMVGASTLFVGIAFVLYLTVDRLLFGHGLANRPALLLSSLLVVLGLQLFALGLLGELIIFVHAGQTKDYQVDRVIEYTNDSAANHAA